MSKEFFVRHDQYDDAVNWCTENCGAMGLGRWGRSLVSTGMRFDMHHMTSKKIGMWKFWFAEESDAVLFKVTWDFDDA